MRRVAFGAAWVVAGTAGAVAAAWLESYAPEARLASVVVAAAPKAGVLALLAWLAGRRDWAVLLGVGWLLLAAVGLAVQTGLATLLSPLAPDRLLNPPRSAYLPIWLVYAASFALVQGTLSALLLWWHVRPAWLWVAYAGIAGLANGLTFYLELFVPVPGLPHTHLYAIAPVITAVGLAMLWRWDAQPPRLRRPRLRLRGESPEVPSASAYGAWVADLEDSLEKPG